MVRYHVFKIACFYIDNRQIIKIVSSNLLAQKRKRLYTHTNCLGYVL